MELTYISARLWVDDMIDPLETQELISFGIETANNNPGIQQFNVGVLQTWKQFLSVFFFHFS